MITAFHDINKIIKETGQGQCEVTELDFSSVKIFRFTEKIKTMVEKCTHLTLLKLVQCELNSLDKLPNLDITGLDVSINKLKDCDLEHLAKYKNLSMLNLSDNFIVNIKSIKTLRVCGKLKDLELAGNEVEKSPNYRGDVFGELKSLQYLDKLDASGLPQPYDSHSDDVISDQEDGQDDEQNEDDENGEEEEDEDDQDGDECRQLDPRRKLVKKCQHEGEEDG